ncbi:MAG: DUF58 domain-containing protein [Mariprofundaceae bacterium]|nr:DUF58 domain-containing protein [Mariprofundaceae bacterium]
MPMLKNTVRHSATELDLQQLISLQCQVSEIAVRRKHIRSPLSGAHISRLRGRGMEFDEVRVYQAGDDVSSIDWKVTARKGIPHTKIFREERERPVLICLDYRQAMFFATQGCLKSVLATQAAALLAWHSIAHGDRLGGWLFSDQEHQEIKPARGRKGVLKFLHACCHANIWQHQQPEVESTCLEATTMRLRYVSKTGSLIYILSDFRGLNDASIANLALLARHNDVVLISIHDPIEMQFPAAGDFPIFDGKTHFICHANHNVQSALEMQYKERMQQLQNLQKKYGIHLIHLKTTDDVTESIRERLWVI